jgi:hypothetical protein
MSWKNDFRFLFFIEIKITNILLLLSSEIVDSRFAFESLIKSSLVFNLKYKTTLLFSKRVISISKILWIVEHYVTERRLYVYFLQGFIPQDTFFNNNNK